MSNKKPKKKSTKKKTKKASSQVAPIGKIHTVISMEDFFADLDGLSGGKPSSVEEAQDIMYQAWEAPTIRKAIALAEKALTVSEDCADAYCLLAELAAKTVEESIELYRKGVEAGERAIGKENFKEYTGYFWSHLETRPYMRSLAGLGQSLWEAGKHEEAVERFSDMLRLNPNDNQGIRDILMSCLVEMNRDKEAEELHKRYEEDGMAVWMYTRALLDFRKHGDSATADKSLKKALDTNKHVPAYLLSRKKLPRTLPDTYGFGDDSEAVLYVSANTKAWEITPGATDWLAKKLK